MADGNKPPEPGAGDPMSRSLMRVQFGSIRFYVALVTVAVVLHFITGVVDRLQWAQPLPEHELLVEFQKRQLDVWTEMNKLLITLATLTIGAVGGFLVNRNKNTPLPQVQLQRAAASWIFCAFSLYFGYLSYTEAAHMLRLGTFDTFDARVLWPTRAQFWTFLISVIALADFVYRSVRDNPERAPQEPGG